MFTGFDHIDVMVKDIHQASKDYERVLGIRPIEVAVEQKGQGYYQTAFPLGNSGSFIYLMHPTGDSHKYQAGAAMRSTLERRGEGIHVVALTVDSVDRQIEYVRRQGDDVIPSKHSHSFFVHPMTMHGVLYQFMERR